jgi:hypothetical protein
MLSINDIQNLLNLLRRARFEGLEEAEVGVYLKHKLIQIGREQSAPQQPQESHGDNLPPTAE